MDRYRYEKARQAKALRPKTVRLEADRENPRVLLHKNWPGYVVVSTEARLSPMRITIPSMVTVPLCKPMGPVSRAQEIAGLRAAFKAPADIYIVCCTTPSGRQYHGYVAVPKAIVPVIDLA